MTTCATSSFQAVLGTESHRPSFFKQARRCEKVGEMDQAIVLYRQAVAVGDTDGMVGLANAHWLGLSVIRSENEAMCLLQQAADLGNYRAVRILLYTYFGGKLKGLKTTQDLEKAQGVFRSAEQLWQEGANRNDMNALHNLGRLYLYPCRHHKRQTRELGETLVRKAAEQNDLHAMKTLARYMYYGKRDKVGGMALWQRAARAGSLSALNAMAFTYLIEPENGDATRMVDLWRQAALKGNPEATQKLGHFYWGMYGGVRNEEQAMSLLVRAAMKGNESALSTLFLHRNEVPSEEWCRSPQALEVLRRLCDRTSYTAVTIMSTLFQTGFAVPRDSREARRWQLLSYAKFCSHTVHQMAVFEYRDTEKLR